MHFTDFWSLQTRFFVLFFGLITLECKNRDVSRRENKHLKLITYKNSHENTMQEVFDFYKEKNLLKRSLKQ